MRRVGRVAAILAALALGAGVLVVVILNQVIERNRGRLLDGLSEGFARPVVVDRFGVGFDRGVSIVLHGLRIADDPRFGTEDFVVAERAYAVVALWPLLRGEVVVRRIVARAPRITVVRTAQGLNVDSLGDAGPRNARPDDARRGSRRSHGAAAAIGLVAIEEGAIRFVDRTATPPRETTIAPLTLELSDLSQTTPVQVELRATVAGRTPTVVRVWGAVGPVGDPPFAVAVPLDVQVAVQGRTVELAALHVSGSVARGDKGNPVASVHVTAPTLRIGRVTLRDVLLQIVDRDRVATLERLELGVFAGTVRGTGRLDHHGGEAPTFALETRVRDVALEEALSAATPDEPPRLAGRLETEWTVSGTLGDEVTVRRSLVARGRAVVHQGALMGVNVADRVFARLPAGVPDLIPETFRQGHPAVFSGDDTRFDELAADLRVANRRLHLDPFVASTADYRLQGRGTVTFAQHADLAATLTMSEGFTADLLALVKEVRYALGDDGHLAVPFRLVGQLPKVRPKIDDGYVARVVAKALVGEGLGDRGGKGKNKGDVTDRLRRRLEELLGR